MPEQLPLMFTLLILLLFARVFGELAERFGIPALTGEVLGGFLLGPSLLGFVHDSPELKAIADLGLLMLIVMAGMEIDRHEIRKSVKGRSLWIAILGFAIPMGAGYGLGTLLGKDSVFSLFLGLCFGITALPVSIRILMDLGKLDSEIGRLIISSAVINDIVSLLVLGVLLDFNDPQDAGTSIYLTVAKNLGKLLAFLIVLAILYRLFKAASKQIGSVGPRFSRFLDILKAKEPGYALYMIFVLALAAFSEFLGLHFIIGAFFATILIPRDLFPAYDFGSLKKTTQSITMGFLAPVFFAYLGILIDLRSISQITLFLYILLAMFLSKLAGGYLGARMAGIPRFKAVTIGFGINTKGIMELVVASIAYQKKFIDLTLFTILVLIALITTLATPFLLKHSFRRVDRLESGA